MAGRSLGAAAGIGVALALAGGCAEGEGIVEVNWQFEDKDLQRIYPPGARSDTCGFISVDEIPYDLRVRLSVIENSEACAMGVEDPACQIIEPIVFPCNRFRGTANPVPSSAQADGSDPGYLMFVQTVVVPNPGEPDALRDAFVPQPLCLLGPGPRVRKVRPGRSTDLEVFQFIVSGIVPDYALKIDSCR